MAEFLNKEKAVAELKNLIKTADQTLILISPYLKLSKDFRELLTFRNNKEKVTTVIFGKQELNPDEMTFLKGLQFVSLRYNEDLHAKCYVNDDKLIITSLNLYEFSIANNKEMGVLIKKNDPTDSELFKEAFSEVDFIKETSVKFDVGSSISYKKQSQGKDFKDRSNKSGYCIRTGIEIPFNPERPLSYDAFKTWNQFGDPDYPEKYCHFSGEQSNGETCVNRPILKKNWNKARDTFGF